MIQKEGQKETIAEKRVQSKERNKEQGISWHYHNFNKLSKQKRDNTEEEEAERKTEK